MQCNINVKKECYYLPSWFREDNFLLSPDLSYIVTGIIFEKNRIIDNNKFIYLEKPTNITLLELCEKYNGAIYGNYVVYDASIEAQSAFKAYSLLRKSN